MIGNSPSDMSVGSTGDNRPPLDADPLLERLNETHGDIRSRAEELAEAESRMPAVGDDKTETALTDYARQLSDCARWIDEVHKAEKAPFLSAGRVVDGWKNALLGTLQPIQVRVRAKLDAWIKEKDRRERERLRAEAAKLAAEARERTGSDPSGAATAQSEAAALRDAARHASAADLTRRHTGTGGVLSAKTSVGHEIVDAQDAAISLWRYFDDDAMEKAVRAWVREHDRNGALKDQLVAHPRKQPLAGVRLFIERKANVR